MQTANGQILAALDDCMIQAWSINDLAEEAKKHILSGDMAQAWVIMSMLSVHIDNLSDSQYIVDAFKWREESE